MSKTASLIGKAGLEVDDDLKVGRRTSWSEWAVSKVAREGWLRRMASELGEVKVMLKICEALGVSRIRKVCGMEVVVEVIDCMVERKEGTRVDGSRWACADGTAFAKRWKRVAVTSCVLILLSM